ncbi:MAG: hypothetical protein QXK37_02875 [Candidatus Woesearchaeota archaeon]
MENLESLEAAITNYLYSGRSIKEFVNQELKNTSIQARLNKLVDYVETSHKFLKKILDKPNDHDYIVMATLVGHSYLCGYENGFNQVFFIAVDQSENRWYVERAIGSITREKHQETICRLPELNLIERIERTNAKTDSELNEWAKGFSGQVWRDGQITNSLIGCAIKSMGRRIVFAEDYLKEGIEDNIKESNYEKVIQEEHRTNVGDENEKLVKLFRTRHFVLIPIATSKGEVFAIVGGNRLYEHDQRIPRNIHPYDSPIIIATHVALRYERILKKKNENARLFETTQQEMIMEKAALEAEISMLKENAAKQTSLSLEVIYRTIIDEIHHTIRNPIIVVGAYARRIQKVLGNSKLSLEEKEKSFRDVIPHIVEETSRLEQQLDELSGRYLTKVSHPDYIDPSILLKEILSAHKREFEERGIQLSTYFTKAKCTIYADLLQMKMILNELLHACTTQLDSREERKLRITTSIVERAEDNYEDKDEISHVKKAYQIVIYQNMKRTPLVPSTFVDHLVRLNSGSVFYMHNVLSRKTEGGRFVLQIPTCEKYLAEGHRLTIN